MKIDLTAEETKALHWCAANPSELFKMRARVAVREMAEAEVARRRMAGEETPIAWTEDDYVRASPLPSASERNAMIRPKDNGA